MIIKPGFVVKRVGDQEIVIAIGKAAEDFDGYITLNGSAKLLWNEDGTPTARTGKILAATPMGRFGETEELEGGLLFLVNNEAAGFITGVVLPIDGGFSAYSGV